MEKLSASLLTQVVQSVTPVVPTVLVAIVGRVRKNK
jgi:hypothetical protein